MMDYEQGLQNGLKIALLAIHRMQYEPEKADFLESVIESAMTESVKRQMKELEEMEKKQIN